MSNSSNGHLSASQRKILALEAHIAQLEVARQEYALLLNVLIFHYGGKYTIQKSEVAAMLQKHEDKIRVVRSEISETGDMTFTFADSEPSLIVLPPGPVQE